LRPLDAPIRLQNKRCAELLHELFEFPSLTPVDRFLKEKASDLGIGDDIFHGSPNSLALRHNYTAGFHWI
jgi:hypothetical protein